MLLLIAVKISWSKFLLSYKCVCHFTLRSYPTAHAMFPGSLPGVSCFKKARKPKKFVVSCLVSYISLISNNSIIFRKWKPFKPPFPPGDRPLSYEEQLEWLFRPYFHLVTYVLKGISSEIRLFLNGWKSTFKWLGSYWMVDLRFHNLF